jgi:protein-S-isoprenylcysteine O-methyltransferase Ste14
MVFYRTHFPDIHLRHDHRPPQCLFPGVAMEAWKHLRAILLLPGVVTVLIPAVILWQTGTDTLELWQSAPAARVVLVILGGVLFSLGLIVLVATIRLFATVGHGTLAPWNPPQKLVVRGVYCHVRNPMISGLFFVLLGESLMAASLPLLGLFAFVVIINALYIPLSEEPGLARRFGNDYLLYKQNVPRWIPRVRAWAGEPERRTT